MTKKTMRQARRILREGGRNARERVRTIEDAYRSGLMTKGERNSLMNFYGSGGPGTGPGHNMGVDSDTSSHDRARRRSMSRSEETEAVREFAKQYGKTEAEMRDKLGLRREAGGMIVDQDSLPTSEDERDYPSNDGAPDDPMQPGFTEDEEEDEEEADGSGMSGMSGPGSGSMMGGESEDEDEDDDDDDEPRGRGGRARFTCRSCEKAQYVPARVAEGRGQATMPVTCSCGEAQLVGAPEGHGFVGVKAAEAVAAFKARYLREIKNG